VARAIGPRIGVTRRARKNLQRAFPEKSAAEIETIIREVWENLGRVVTEYPHLSRIKAFTPDAVIEVRGTEHVEAARARGKPLIFFAGHLGNWEVSAIAAKAFGVPLHLIYRPANNPAVEQIYREGRGDIAAGLIPRGATGRARTPRRPAARHPDRPEDERRHRGAVLRPRRDDGPRPRAPGLQVRLHGPAGAG
jgi:KDO2-lipid IV(A) lauroyltransferase